MAIQGDKFETTFQRVLDNIVATVERQFERNSSGELNDEVVTKIELSHSKKRGTWRAEIRVSAHFIGEVASSPQDRADPGHPSPLMVLAGAAVNLGAEDGQAALVAIREWINPKETP